jgi:hypothetical protein
MGFKDQQLTESKMVQSRSTKGTSSAAEEMPMYMQRSGAGYIFRRAIPASLYPVLNKRELKIPLGSDYKAACCRAREEAGRSDQLFADAVSLCTSPRVCFARTSVPDFLFWLARVALAA